MNSNNTSQTTEKKKLVIFDCDNTMGLEGKDVDDGLTLIYLLGRPDIELLGITLTYGNSNIEDVVRVTEQLCQDLNINDVPLFFGKEAHEFLAQTCASQKDEVNLLCTGSMYNIHEASLLDEDFFENIRHIYAMGGITEPLLINGHKVDELNFSINAEATCTVLCSPCPITLLNGHTTAHAIFGRAEIEELKKHKDSYLFGYVLNAIEPWIEKMKRDLDIDGFSNWDTAAAIAISYPELFSDEQVYIDPTIESLASGNINVGKNGKLITMPSRIKDMGEFNRLIFEAFHKFQKKYCS